MLSQSKHLKHSYDNGILVYLHLAVSMAPSKGRFKAGTPSTLGSMENMECIPGTKFREPQKGSPNSTKKKCSGLEHFNFNVFFFVFLNFQIEDAFFVYSIDGEITSSWYVICILSVHTMTTSRRPHYFLNMWSLKRDKIPSKNDLDLGSTEHNPSEMLGGGRPPAKG